MESRYGLGIDAGGTYTDVVLLDLTTGKVRAATKAPTTHPDPTDGIRNTLGQIDATLLPKVGMVSLATTFATNAIVEDRGAEAGLILVGYDERPHDIPRTTQVLMVDGGHTVSGEEKASLNIKALDAKLEAFLDGLDAVAVTGFFSVRNPEHELWVAQIIRDRFDLPVVRGHRLSMRLDAVKRATTAWWNARLIPIISKLIKSTKDILSEKDIRAPLMVVRGDGTLMSAETALDRPVDTLLSGPAASILGAKHLSGLDDGLIVDMGGTTTDIAVLSAGRVDLAAGGAEVGKWKTHVKAAKVRTIGLGGDSLISLDGDGHILVGPQRVQPLCVSACQRPEILELLQKILLISSKPSSMSVNPCSFYIRLDERPSGERRELPGCFESGPVSEFLLFREAEQWSSAWELERAERRGLVFRSAFTPTDLRVACGSFELGSTEASRLGLSVFSKHLGMEPSSFSKTVEREISRRLCLEVAKFLGGKNSGPLTQLLSRGSWDSSSSKKRVSLDVQVKLTAPVIGAGAPAVAWLPEALGHLHTECIVPESYDVSVAVGALVGMVDVSFTGKIRLIDSGRYTLFTDAGRESFNTLEMAIEHGRLVLESIAKERMLRDRVTEPLLDFSVEERAVKGGHGEGIHIETELRLRATGRPGVQMKG